MISSLDLFFKLESRIGQQGGDAEILMGEISNDVVLQIALGKKFFRETKDKYYKKLWGRALRGCKLLPDETIDDQDRRLSYYVGLHLNGVKNEIRGLIRRMGRGMINMKKGPKSCSLLRDLIDRECPLFTVSVETNFLGEPYFRFGFQGRDIFQQDKKWELSLVGGIV